MDEQKYRRIIESAKQRFLGELQIKCAELEHAVDSWRRGEISGEQFVDRAYRLTHALKGVALTVGFPDVHEVAEQTDEFMRRQDEAGLPPAAAELERLAGTLESLRQYR